MESICFICMCVDRCKYAFKDDRDGCDEVLRKYIERARAEFEEEWFEYIGEDT